MPSDRIRADYDELAAIAQEMQQEGYSVDSLIVRLRRCVDALEYGGWIGRGANSFYLEMHNDVFPALQRLANALLDGGDAVNQISQILHEAEEEASALFQRRA
ncbi:MAG: WXG100 family type VII secretion target [Anaerolineae bacterium]|nr:WXG100 family type VII secretion target [Anaerolineae bacterium]